MFTSIKIINKFLFIGFMCCNTVNAMIPVGPSYLDNGECLVKAQKGCSIGSWSSPRDSYQQENINESVNQNLWLSEGTLTFKWPGTDHYFSNWMQENNKGDPGWRVLGEPDNYQFKIKNDAPIKVEVWMKHIDSTQEVSAECASKSPLRLGTSYYDYDRNRGAQIVCKIPGGYWPTRFKVSASIDAEIQLYKPNTAKEKILTFPGAAIEITGAGCYRWTQANGCNSSWNQKTIRRQIMNGGKILLNDRTCALTIQNEVKFDKIPSSSTGTIKEVSTPFFVKCQGYQKTNNGPQNVSGLGIKSELYAVRIHSLSGHLSGAGIQSNKTIGLKTASNLRDDLYVDASFTPGLGCGVNALFTDGTSNKLLEPITLDGKQAVQTIPTHKQPYIHWRLCNPKNDSLKEGTFEGQAELYIDYR